MALNPYHSAEILKCGRDPVYFFNKYVKIQHPTKGSIPFSTYGFQDDVVRDFIEHRLNVVLKARQLGLSTITAAFALWMVLFQQNTNILVVATDLRTAINFIRKCKFMLTNLPKWLVLGDISSETKQSIETSRGSILKAVPTSDSVGRSEALSLLIIDEAAFIQGFDELWKGLVPTLSTGGRAIIISTPNGTGNKFFDIYDKAVSGNNEFNPIKLHWTVHPERDQAWFESATRNMTKKEIAQEHECDFIASGDTFLGGDLLATISKQVKDPIRRDGMDRNIWIWKEPVKEHRYILSADTARGDGKDFSAFHVIDITEMEVVVEYKGKFPPDRFAEMINEVGLKYNRALVCPENNSVGYATIQKLCALDYPLIYNNEQKTLDMWNTMMIKKGDLQRPSGKLGIFTTGQKKNVMLTKMDEVIRNGMIKVYSERLYREFTTFLWLSNSKVGADRGKNDDLVMSLAIGCWLLDTSDFATFSEDSSKALLDSMTISTVKLDDIIEKQVNKDNNVFVPVASNNSNVEKKMRPQILADKWRWLLS